MISLDNVKQISPKLSFGNGISEDDLGEDVSEIVYRIDVFECDDAPIIDRHIDIEYSFGDYYEVHERQPFISIYLCIVQPVISTRGGRKGKGFMQEYTLKRNLRH